MTPLHWQRFLQVKQLVRDRYYLVDRTSVSPTDKARSSYHTCPIGLLCSLVISIWIQGWYLQAYLMASVRMRSARKAAELAAETRTVRDDAESGLPSFSELEGKMQKSGKR